MAWSPQQETAIKAVSAWLGDPRRKQVFRLFGFAGTGKTTLAIEIAGIVKGRTLFGAFSGKASQVMRNKGCFGAQTLHSLIYKVEDGEDGKPKFTRSFESLLAKAKLLIVDEVSMVGEELGRDLLSFGTPILALGDPAQLPPIRGAGFFDSSTPDVMLTEIHRQAADNPIIHMSMEVREGRRLKHGQYGESKVISRTDLVQAEVTEADQVLCGLNRTRRAFNNRIRTLGNIDIDETPYPLIGERLICLKNNREKGLLNGGMWKTKTKAITQFRSGGEGKIIKLDIDSQDNGNAQLIAEIPVEFFDGTEEELRALPWWVRRAYDEFDYAYAITVHKSQGSQFNSVMLFDESQSFRDVAARHLYTGITRAAEKITIVV